MYYALFIILSRLIYTVDGSRKLFPYLLIPPYPTDGEAIKYYVDNDVTDVVEDGKILEIENFFSHVQNHTCLKFSRQNKIVDNLGFNFKISNNYNILNISKFKTIPTTIYLENYVYDDIYKLRFFLGNTLVPISEIQRIDNNEEININWNNIDDSYKKLFRKVQYYYKFHHNTDYDFASALHFEEYYGKKTNAGATWSPKFEVYKKMTRANPYLVYSDFRKINSIYCDNKCKKYNDCEHGGHYYDGNCDKCTCPTMFTGNRCEKLETSTGSCGGEANYKATGKEKEMSLENVKGTCYISIKTTNKYKKVQIIVKKLEITGSKDCNSDERVEIKYRQDKGVEGIYLCENYENLEIPTLSSEIYIKFKDINGKAKLNIVYKEIW